MIENNEGNDILIIKLSKNRGLSRIKKILSQKYDDQMHQFTFEKTNLKCYPSNFIIRTKEKKKCIIQLKDFEIRSVDECYGRWYSSKLKYRPPNPNYSIYSSVIIADEDRISDLAEEMKDSGFKFTVLDNCLVIQLTETSDNFNHKNIQEYLQKRLVTCNLVNQTYLNDNKGDGHVVYSSVYKPDY